LRLLLNIATPSLQKVKGKRKCLFLKSIKDRKQGRNNRQRNGKAKDKEQKREQGWTDGLSGWINY